MSINMYVGEVRQQVQSVTSNCQTTIVTMEQIQQALSAIIIEPRLKGATYDSMKNYFNTVYMPVTKGFILVCERMIESNQQFLNRYLDQVDVNSLQESVLEERIRQYNRLSEMLDSVIDPTGLTDRMVDGLQEMRQQTSRKLDSLREYDYFSIQIFDELEAQLATLEAGVTILSEGKAWNQSTGTFSTMGLNLDWVGDINKSWKSYDDKKKGIDEEKIAELKEYKVYAMIYMDMDGNPKVSWQLEKNGKGVMNPELYQYLAKAGQYLDADSFEFITRGARDAKVKDGWRNGYNYVTGEVYNKTLGKIVSSAQTVEDGVNWLNESELGQAIQVLGFSYAMYKVTTIKGSSTVKNEKVGGAELSAKDLSQFEKLKGDYASKEIINAERIGSGLKDDPLHRSASFLTEEQLAKGRVTSFTGGDGKSYSVLQSQGKLNGLDGIYEYVLDSTGKITHQRFIDGGKITGFPNQKVPKGGY